MNQITLIQGEEQQGEGEEQEDDKTLKKWTKQVAAAEVSNNAAVLK